MSALLTTAAGWRGTARSVRWSPILITPVVTSLALVVASVLTGRGVGNMRLLGEACLALTVATAAFIADDASFDAAPATPVEAPVRLVTRAALAAPVVTAGWLLVLAVYAWVTPVAVTVNLAERALAGLGLGAVALGLAALGGMWRPVASPGAAGMAAMICLAVLSGFVPAEWLTVLPPAELLWPVAAVVAVAATAAATKEPAR